jgi:hypothetical protein
MQQATCVVRTSNEIFAKRLFFSLREPHPTKTKTVNQEMSLGDLDQVSGGVGISDLKAEAAAITTAPRLPPPRNWLQGLQRPP